MTKGKWKKLERWLRPVVVVWFVADRCWNCFDWMDLFLLFLVGLWMIRDVTSGFRQVIDGLDDSDAEELLAGLGALSEEHRKTLKAAIAKREPFDNLIAALKEDLAKRTREHK